MGVFLGINPWYKICTEVFELSAEWKSQLPSITQGELFETHLALTFLEVFARGARSSEPLLPLSVSRTLFNSTLCVGPAIVFFPPSSFA